MKKIEYCASPQKNNKESFKNYPPVSLLPIFSKEFEKAIFNKMYTFLQNEQLLNPNESGFRPSDWYINQSLSITLETFRSYNAPPPLKIKSIFLDISTKAFDTVWHEGLLYKLNPIGISRSFYKSIESFLSNRFQGVFLNGQTLSWRPILA